MIVCRSGKGRDAMENKVLEVLFENRCSVPERYPDEQQIVIEKVLDIHSNLDSIQNLECFKQNAYVDIHLIKEIQRVCYL